MCSLLLFRPDGVRPDSPLVNPLQMSSVVSRAMVLVNPLQIPSVVTGPIVLVNPLQMSQRTRRHGPNYPLQIPSRVRVFVSKLATSCGDVSGGACRMNSFLNENSRKIRAVENDCRRMILCHTDKFEKWRNQVK